MKLIINKSTRTIEVPSSASREELLCIISKWAYLVTKDENNSPYQIQETGTNPEKSSKPDENIVNMFNNIFSDGNSKSSFDNIFKGFK